MGEDKKKTELTFKDFERMGEGVVKKAFKSFRQILIGLLYLVAIFYALNDFSFTVVSARDFASEKFPWLVLYILAHYFCRDYGIQKGREDEEFVAVDKHYRELCDKARGRRKELEVYCHELAEYYTESRRAEVFSALGVRCEEDGKPILAINFVDEPFVTEKTVKKENGYITSLTFDLKNIRSGDGEIYFNAYRIETDGGEPEKHLFALNPTMQPKFHVPSKFLWLKDYI